MNKKLITSSLIASLVFSFALAANASAFWPFDALFKKSGDVKAETSERAYIPERTPQTSKAYMTYQTLVSMNDACRKMFAQDYPSSTKPRVTPSARENSKFMGTGAENPKKMPAGSIESTESMYLMEFGIESKSDKELTSIYNNLKARCDNIANLVSRMQRIYKGNVKPTVSSTPTPTIMYDEGGVERPTVTPTRKPIINFRYKDSSKNRE